MAVAVAARVIEFYHLRATLYRVSNSRRTFVPVCYRQGRKSPNIWQYAARLRQVVADINRSYAVGALCQCFPDRLDELIRRQGDRLRS